MSLSVNLSLFLPITHAALQKAPEPKKGAPDRGHLVVDLLLVAKRPMPLCCIRLCCL
jgi:hypothetical protein